MLQKKLTGNETADDIQKKIDKKQKQLDKLESADKHDFFKINKVGWELDELKNMKEAIEKKGNGDEKYENRNLSQDARNYGLKNEDDLKKRGYEVVDEYKGMAIVKKGDKYTLAGKWKGRENYPPVIVVGGYDSIDKAKEYADKQLKGFESQKEERDFREMNKEKRSKENTQLKNIPVGLKDKARELLNDIEEGGNIGSYNKSKTKQYVLDHADGGYNFTVYDINNDTSKTYFIEKNEVKKSYTERVNEIKNSIEDLTRF